MHLGVFIDRLVDHHQQVGAPERQHMLMQIGITTIMRGAIAIAIEGGWRIEGISQARSPSRPPPRRSRGRHSRSPPPAARAAIPGRETAAAKWPERRDTRYAPWWRARRSSRDRPAPRRAPTG